MVEPSLLPIEVLVVDDSATFRMILSRAVKEQGGAHLLGTADNGEAALHFADLHPDLNLILLDVSMPILDGPETLRRLRRDHPNIDVIMMSGVDKSQTGLTMHALSMGALDFIPKPEGEGPSESFRKLHEAFTPLFELARSRTERRRGREARTPAPRVPQAPPLPKPVSPVATAAAAPVPAPDPAPRPEVPAPSERPAPARAPERPTPASLRAPVPPRSRPVAPAPRRQATAATVKSNARLAALKHIDVLALGVSTGGPNALQVVIPGLPADLPVPLVAVQHMPPLFTASLAERLDRDSKIHVVEAQEGMELEPGVMYLAPGGHHMVLQTVAGRTKVKLTDTPPVNSCRPSVDVLFHSVVENFGGNVLSVILTGMGNDGAAEVASLRARGAYSLAQDEATSVVWGMPGAVTKAGQADEVLPLPDIAPRITQILREKRLRA